MNNWLNHIIDSFLLKLNAFFLLSPLYLYNKTLNTDAAMLGLKSWQVCRLSINQGFAKMPGYQPTWSYSEPASSKLCCMANWSRSSSSSLMLSRCLPPSMVYPDGASNTHWGISPARQDTASTRGKVKSKRREGYLTVEEIILKEENWRVLKYMLKYIFLLIRWVS